MQPSVEIDVDETRGVWRTDGLPMLYVPRHFFVNLHRDVEAALGREAYREVLARSGARSALRWCRRQSELGVGDGPAIFAFYLERLSARGWGRFSVERMDADALSATVSLRDSIYVLEAGETASEPVCYIFEGFLVGAMQFVCETLGRPAAGIECAEIECAALGAEACLFELTGRAAG